VTMTSESVFFPRSGQVNTFTDEMHPELVALFTGIADNINMAASASPDRLLALLTKICLALPETARRDSGKHAAFLVRKKVFTYFLHDHHGDGIISIACKALPGDNTVLAAAQPARFYLPAYIGPRGWVALRLDRGKVDWDEVSELVMGSYRLIAPARLIKLIQRS
jgi:predicted DNA-binding protein (MmcQ/YjbR family)